MCSLRHDGTHRVQAGFSLIEILAVIGVFGLLIQILAVGFGPAGQAEIVKTTQQIAASIRFGYDRARVYGDHYRLAIDLDKGTFALQRGDDRMYLPATDRDGELVDAESLAKREEERTQRDREAADRFNSSLQAKLLGPPAAADGGGAPPANVPSDGTGGALDDPYSVAPREVPRRRPPHFAAFEPENTLPGLGAQVELPPEIKIVYVRTDADREPITKGQAYIYFFPNGQTQKAHIQLADDEGKSTYTIKVHPLTGKVEIVGSLVALELPGDVRGGADDLGRKIERRSFDAN